MAVAAISASYARAAGFRPALRSAAATSPNARAHSASNGRTTKSASACCRCCCRALRSAGSSVACGPTDSSARVIALMTDSSGSSSGSRSSPSRITVEVSSTPLASRVTTPGQSGCRCPHAGLRDSPVEDSGGDVSVRRCSRWSAATDATRPPGCRHVSPQTVRHARHGAEPRHRCCAGRAPTRSPYSQEPAYHR